MKAFFSGSIKGRRSLNCVLGGDLEKKTFLTAKGDLFLERERIINIE
jgi:hypothetical protein